MPIDREVAADGRVVDRLPEPRDERHEHLLQPREDRRHVGGRHARLVVVEQDVVGVLERCETVGVPLYELEPALEVRAEELEVGRGARLEPVDVPLRAGSRELGAQLARDASLLLVVAPGHADHARFDRLRVGGFLELPQLVEERAELGSGGELVSDPGERRGLLGPRGSTEWRHLRLLVPAEQEAGALDVGDLAEAPQELVEAGAEVSHDRGAYPPTRARMTALPPPSNRHRPTESACLQPRHVRFGHLTELWVCDSGRQGRPGSSGRRSCARSAAA